MMAEPLTIAAIVGLTSGAGAALVTKAWSSGGKWLSTYFQDHEPVAIAAANAGVDAPRLFDTASFRRTFPYGDSKE